MGEGLKRAFAATRHSRCQDVIWLVPDMAIFPEMGTRMFTARCKECGYEYKLSSLDIRTAIADTEKAKLVNAKAELIREGSGT